MPAVDAGLRDALRREHGLIDELFGRFLAAATGGDAASAGAAIGAFDEALRRHTGLEEERLLTPVSGKRTAAEAETPHERLYRELRLEHVQVRELSGMIRRLVEERGDLAGALRLAGNLARRWDAHTGREERELFSAS
jgi:hypothetical protein